MLELYVGSVTMLTAAFTGLWRYNKLEPKWLRLFTVFILLEIFIQFSGYYYVRITGIQDDIFIFNINIFLEYGSYLLMLYFFVQNSPARNLVLILFASFSTFYILQIFVLNRFSVIGSTYSSISVNFGEIVSLVSCFIYLAELLTEDGIIDFLRLPQFWIATGIMVAIMGAFLYVAFMGYILKHNLDPEGTVYGWLMAVANILEYALFNVALCYDVIWKKSRY